VYRYWTSILFAAVIVQIGAAGYGAFYADTKVGGNAGLITQKQFDHGFAFHIALGFLIFAAAILLFVFSLAARLGRKRVLLTLALPALVFVQIQLAMFGGSTPAVGALHPVNALLILGLAGHLTHKAWAKLRARHTPSS
jgi:hypothetical protein